MIWNPLLGCIFHWIFDFLPNSWKLHFTFSFLLRDVIAMSITTQLLPQMDCKSYQNGLRWILLEIRFVPRWCLKIWIISSLSMVIINFIEEVALKKQTCFSELIRLHQSVYDNYYYCAIALCLVYIEHYTHFSL